MTQSVYVIRSESGPIKIGISKQPKLRLADIVRGQPFSAELIYSMNDDEVRATTIERIAHQLLSEACRRGEWFDITPEEAIEALYVALELAKAGVLPNGSNGDPRIITPMSRELVDAIDEYRFENRLPSRAEAIRSLIELALQTIAQQQDFEGKGSPRRAVNPLAMK